MVLQCHQHVRKNATILAWRLQIPQNPLMLKQMIAKQQGRRQTTTPQVSHDRCRAAPGASILQGPGNRWVGDHGLLEANFFSELWLLAQGCVPPPPCVCIYLFIYGHFSLMVFEKVKQKWNRHGRGNVSILKCIEIH